MSIYRRCYLDVYFSTQQPAHSWILNQWHARPRTSSAYQPASCPPHDVTASLKVQWRYWTITAIAFGDHIYIMWLTLKKTPPVGCRTSCNIGTPARATTCDRERWFHRLCTRWQFRLKTLVSANSGDCNSICTKKKQKSVSSKRSPAACKLQISKGRGGVLGTTSD